MSGRMKRLSSNFAARGEQEKFLFIAAAGTALAVVTVFIFVAGMRSGAEKMSARLEPPQGPIPADSVIVVAPETEVAPGTALAQVKFKKMHWPRLTAPDGAFSDVTAVAGLYAKEKLLPGLPLLRKDTATQELAMRMSTLALTPSHRAVTLEVDEISTLEGHANSGMHVDVVLTYTQNGVPRTDIIVQNARIISYGGDPEARPAAANMRKPTKIARTLTLDVPVRDALAIKTAAQMGRMSLIMRAPGEEGPPAVTSFSANEFAQAAKAPKSEPAPACVRGKARLDSKEYLVLCDGTLKLL